MLQIELLKLKLITQHQVKVMYVPTKDNAADDLSREHQVKVMYVPTKDNPADDLSRMYLKSTQV